MGIIPGRIARKENPASKPCRWGAWQKMRLACTTCTATYGNGRVRRGRTLMMEMRLYAIIMPQVTSCAVVRGATMPTTAARRTATAMRPATASTAAAFVFSVCCSARILRYPLSCLFLPSLPSALFLSCLLLFYPQKPIASVSS